MNLDRFGPFWKNFGREVISEILNVLSESLLNLLSHSFQIRVHSLVTPRLEIKSRRTF
jgi:hypothetical protein